jgi:hypothetical protein
MTLGKEGVAGDNDSQDLFNAPSNVVIAPDDSIFVGDGHGIIDGKPSNARIVHFSKDGKFIKTWGHRGTGPGEFETPHMLAMDSQGRLFVADRGNSRIQIFDQDGRYLTERKQFGRPSGVYAGPDSSAGPEFKAVNQDFQSPALMRRPRRLWRMAAIIVACAPTGFDPLRSIVVPGNTRIDVSKQVAGDVDPIWWIPRRFSVWRVTTNQMAE